MEVVEQDQQNQEQGALMQQKEAAPCSVSAGRSESDLAETLAVPSLVPSDPSLQDRTCLQSYAPGSISQEVDKVSLKKKDETC